ncbi:MAG: hypothetical protein WBG90_16085 [Saonia sp.]
MKRNYRIFTTAAVMTILLFSEVKANILDLNQYHNVSEIKNANAYFHDNSTGVECNDIEDLDLNEIVYLEDEGEVNLGFDTYFYLPEGFDPYEGMKIDLDDIHYMECEEEIHLNFNVNDFLPKNFDPFTLP